MSNAPAETGQGPGGRLTQDAEPARGRVGWTWERQDASATRGWVYRGTAILVAIAVGAVYLATTVHTPGVLTSVIKQSLENVLGIQELVVLTTPFLLTAFAVLIPLRLGLWNVGGEGQFFAGAWTATGLAFMLPHAPGWFLIPGMIVAGAAGGAIWITVPALAKIYLNVNEIITTLLLNLTSTLWVTYWIVGSWRDTASQGGSIQSRFIPVRSHLPPIPMVSGGLDSGLVIALAIVVGVGLFLRYSMFGYRTTVVGGSRQAATFAGVNLRTTVLIAMLAAGALAGMAGVLQMTGNTYQLTPGLSNNTGYLGIAVAVLAGNSVAGIVVMSVLLAAIMDIGQVVQVYGVSSEDVFVLIGLLLLLSAISEVLSHYRLVQGPEQRR